MWPRAILAVATVALVVAACGQEQAVVPGLVDPPDQPEGPPSTLTQPSDFRLPGLTGSDGVVSDGPAIEAGAWVDVTSNLVGMDSTCGNLSYVSAHPETDGVIANVATKGLFALDESAQEWSLLASNIDHRTQWVQYDDDDPARFWVSGAYGRGVYRTDDGGSSFRQLGSLIHVDAIAVDTSDPQRQVLLAGVHEETRLMRSIDGGGSWTEISDNLPQGVGFTTAPLFVDSGFLVGTYAGPEAGLYRTDDEGETWTRIFDRAVFGGPLVNDDVIAWNLDDDRGGIAVSTDGGETFTSSTSRPGGRSLTLTDLGDGMLASVSREGVAVTDDLGRTWRKVGDDLPFQPVGVTYSAERSSFFAWTFTCFTEDADNAVPPQSVMQLEIERST